MSKKETKEKLKDLKHEYLMEFDECFPTFLLRRYNINEQLELIEQCLKDKKPIDKILELDLDDDIIY